MTAAAARLLLPRVAKTTATALFRGPLDSFSSRFRTLEPPLLRPLALFSRNLSEAAFDAQALDTRVPATVITGFLGSGKVPPRRLALRLPFPSRTVLTDWCRGVQYVAAASSLELRQRLMRLLHFSI